MGWYGTGIGGEGGVYLSIYQMHTALVTAIRMPPPTAHRLPPVLRPPQVASALDCAFVYKLIKLKVSG